MSTEAHKSAYYTKTIYLREKEIDYPKDYAILLFYSLFWNYFVNDCTVTSIGIGGEQTTLIEALVKFKYSNVMSAVPSETAVAVPNDTAKIVSSEDFLYKKRERKI